MKRLVLLVEDVDYRQPAVLVHLRELELFLVVSLVGGGPHVLDWNSVREVVVSCGFL